MKPINIIQRNFTTINNHKNDNKIFMRNYLSQRLLITCRGDMNNSQSLLIVFNLVRNDTINAACYFILDSDLHKIIQPHYSKLKWRRKKCSEIKYLPFS